jgi:protein TonB
MSHVASAFALEKSRFPRTIEICLGTGILLHLLAFALFPPVQMAPFRLSEPPDQPTRMVDFRIPQDPALPTLPQDLTPPDLDALARELGRVADIVPDVPEPSRETAETGPARPGAAVAHPIHVVDEQKPALLKSVVPKYPALAREAGAEGTVVVEVLVGPYGQVLDARVVKSDTVEALKRAALEAARQFLFAPARQQHTAVPVWVTVPFTFRLH